MKKIKILAIEEGKKTNLVVEEALQDLIRKYEGDSGQDERTL